MGHTQVKGSASGSQRSRTPTSLIRPNIIEACKLLLAGGGPFNKKAVARQANVSRQTLDDHAKDIYAAYEREWLKQQGMLSKEAARRCNEQESRGHSRLVSEEKDRKIDELTEIVLAIIANVQTYAPELLDLILQPLERFDRQ